MAVSPNSLIQGSVTGDVLFKVLVTREDDGSLVEQKLYRVPVEKRSEFESGLSELTSSLSAPGLKVSAVCVEKLF